MYWTSKKNKFLSSVIDKLEQELVLVNEKLTALQVAIEMREVEDSTSSTSLFDEGGESIESQSNYRHTFIKMPRYY